MLSLTLWVSLLLWCVNCDLQKGKDFRILGFLVLFRKVYFFPLACAMSQLTHSPSFPVPPRSTGLFPHPLGFVATVSPAGCSDPLGAVIHWVHMAASIHRRRPAPGITAARLHGGRRWPAPVIRRREAQSVPVARWGRVGPATEGAKTGRYHEQFFIFSN